MRKAFTSSVFLLCANEVLLVHHKRFDLWVPVGGELEPNESPMDAAIREVMEETGLSLTEKDFEPLLVGVPGAPRGLLCFEEHDGAGKGLHMNFSFVAGVGDTRIMLCEEHSDSMWVNAFDVLECRTKLPTTTPSVVWCVRKIGELLGYR